MNCPHCNVTLVMTERSGVEIDYCPQCRGVWLDRGELDKIIERAGALSPVAAPQPVAQQGSAPQQQPAYQQGYQQPAVHPQFGGNDGHHNGHNTGHDGHHDGHKNDKYGYGHKKKKSMLSELFDF